MDNEQKIIKHIDSLINEKNIPPELPIEIRDIQGIKEIDSTLRNLRYAIKSIGDGALSDQLSGNGYLIGLIKNIQATLKNLIWHTKAVSKGNFSYKVEFLGEFSEAFNDMSNKLESTINELKDLEEKLRESEEIHRLLADNATDVIWVMDLDGKFKYVSPSVEKLRGYTPEEVMLQSKEELLCEDSIEYMEKGLEDTIYAVKNNLPFKIFRGDMEQPCKDGTTVWTDLTVSGIYDKENNFLGLLGVSRDITERKKMEDEIRRLTEIDRLTQIYNRLKLDSVIKSEMERSKRSNSHFSIILMDIDRFKMVNDHYGHIVGDEVLKEIASIIKSSIRKIDTPGRWGGEEFLIILPESNLEGALNLAEKLRKKIEKHKFSKVGNLTSSFGVAEFENGISENELLKRADDGMYEAKKTGRNKVCFIKK